MVQEHRAWLRRLFDNPEALPIVFRNAPACSAQDGTQSGSQRAGRLAILRCDGSCRPVSGVHFEADIGRLWVVFCPSPLPLRERVGRGVRSKACGPAPFQLRLGSKLPSLRISPRQSRKSAMGSVSGRQEFFRNAAQSPCGFRDCASTLLMPVGGWKTDSG